MEEVKKDAKIHIIGAGISGLTAAINLEKHGYSPTVIESSDRVGGRVKTDIVDGFQLDHGFQVLLDAYPIAKKYLNYDELSLQKLLPGALIFNEQNRTAFGDPLRDTNFLMSTVFSNLGTLSDKWKIYKLNQALKSKELDQIFESEEKTTLEYLQDYGFTDRIIANFFRPFFSGIFLEPNLETSSRMFEFVYKMFGNGTAVIPKDGIEAIPKQLKAQLKQTSFMFNTKVKQISNQHIALENGDTLASDFIIVATDPSTLIPTFSSTLQWKSCDNLYFKVTKDIIGKPLIGLHTKEDAWVNNIFFPTSIDTSTSGKQQLLSVTVVKDHNLIEDELLEKVTKELRNDFGIEEPTFLKRYQIPRALPHLEDLKYSRDESESLLTEKIALAGDNQLNSSLNAAMVSGEAAAEIAHRATSQSLLTFA